MQIEDVLTDTCQQKFHLDTSRYTQKLINILQNVFQHCTWENCEF